MRKLKAFLWQGILLTLTAFLIQAVGIAFNIYLSNKLGANGIGLFQLIMSIYSFAVTFATAGINLAATRLVAEEMAHSSSRGAKKAMRVCFLYSLTAGGVAAFFLCLLSNYISVHWLHPLYHIFTYYGVQHSFYLCSLCIEWIFYGNAANWEKCIFTNSGNIFACRYFHYRPLLSYALRTGICMSCSSIGRNTLGDVVIPVFLYPLPTGLETSQRTANTWKTYCG